MVFSASRWVLGFYRFLRLFKHLDQSTLLQHNYGKGSIYVSLYHRSGDLGGHTLKCGNLAAGSKASGAYFPLVYTLRVHLVP